MPAFDVGLRLCRSHTYLCPVCFPSPFIRVSASDQERWACGGELGGEGGQRGSMTCVETGEMPVSLFLSLLVWHGEIASR